MFGNAGYNNTTVKNNNNSASTNIRTFFGELSCFQISYWDDKLSLKINPLASVNADGIRQYDYSRKIQTALTTDKCIALAKAIEKKIFPAIEEGKDASVAAGLTKSTIAINVKKENDDLNVYFTIYPLAEDGGLDKTNAYVYKFNKTNVFLDFAYDNAGTEEQVHSEFIYLYTKMKNIVNVTADAAHSINIDNASKSTGTKPTMNQAAPANNYSAPVSSFNMSDFPFN